MRASNISYALPLVCVINTVGRTGDTLGCADIKKRSGLVAVGAVGGAGQHEWGRGRAVSDIIRSNELEEIQVILGLSGVAINPVAVVEVANILIGSHVGNANVRSEIGSRQRGRALHQ